MKKSHEKGCHCSNFSRTKMSSLKSVWENLLISVFVDNVLLYKIFKCHRMSSRSFFVRNRQFHICARCTGLFVGYIVSPIFLVFGGYTFLAFTIFLAALILDGVTQLLGWRESNNNLRFLTGLGTGATSLSLVWLIISHLVPMLN